MKIFIYNKTYFKESYEIHSAIKKGAEALYGRIRRYEEQNIEFCRIFNDDKIKYDKHGQFYTFKYKRSNLQLRILYSYMVIDGVPVILVADYFVKKRDSKKYISRFDFANDLNPLEVYSQSTEVCMN